MPLNGFDRLIMASKFPINENQIFFDNTQFSNLAIKILKKKIRKNHDALLKKFHTSSCFNEMVVDIEIKDESILNVISKCLDRESRKIFSMLDKPQTPLELLKKLKIPSTSLYRKINLLEKDGLITQTGVKKTNKSKATLYIKTFDNIIFQTGKKNSVILTIKHSALQNSIVYSVISI